MKRISRGALLSVLLLAACTAPMMHGNESASIPMEMDGDSGRRGGMMGGMMGGATGGMMGGMMDRHHATVPEEYRGVTNPAAVTDASLERGAEVYSLNCASCHGDGGMGDGPAGLVLDPPASPIAHTSQMLGDDYLFWRLSEGGAHFASAMPAWKEILDEQTRWDLINYMRALGSGDVTPRRMAGGATFDPQQELLHRQEMLDTALADEVISQTQRWSP